MKVLFGYNPSDMNVFSLHWKDDGGELHEKTLRTDGSVTDKVMSRSSMRWVFEHFSSSHYWMYPAVVDDVRIAFKYLGKTANLVFLLPEAVIDVSE